MSVPRLRALLVDDEVLARLALRQALASHPELEIVGECGHVAEAKQAVEALAPDVIFLDIQMPGVNGFELVRQLDPESLPIVVFATAFDAHAVQAFEAGALDYLLKPIDLERFDRTIERVKRQWQRLSLEDSDAAPPRAGEPLQRISVPLEGRVRVIRVEEIDWIRADGNYVQLHLGREALLYRETLRALEGALDPARFLRIHRGTLVNLDRVQELHPLFHGGAEVVLRDGTRLALSRRFRGAARRALGLR